MNIQEDTNCLPTSIYLEEEALSPLSPETVGKSKPLPIAISVPTPKESTDPTSLKSRSMEISKTITHAEGVTYSQADFPVQIQVLQGTKKDLMEMNPNSGLSICDASKKESQDSSLSKIPRDYSIAEWEKSFKAYPKAGTFANGRLSPLEPLAVPKLEGECLSLPTMTTGLGSGRNAGATRLEKWLKDNDFVQSTQALSVEMMALIFGFPMDWALCLLESPKESKAETRLEPCSGERSMSTVPPLQLSESSTLIAVSVGTIVRRKAASGKGKVVRCTEGKIWVSWLRGAVVAYSIAQFRNNIDVLVQPAISLNSIDASNDSLLDQPLESLIAWRDRLIASGASPEGVWLSCSQVRDREFYQVQWRSGVAHPWLGGQKSKYVGIVDSKEHKSAIAIHRAGQELVKVQKQIKKLQEK